MIAHLKDRIFGNSAGILILLVFTYYLLHWFHATHNYFVMYITGLPVIVFAWVMWEHFKDLIFDSCCLIALKKEYNEKRNYV